jgi:hypothetical protein
MTTETYVRRAPCRLAQYQKWLLLQMIAIKLTTPQSADSNYILLRGENATQQVHSLHPPS